jgi:hypothetical protein
MVETPSLTDPLILAAIGMCILGVIFLFVALRRK